MRAKQTVYSAPTADDVTWARTHWVTENMKELFRAEIANEANGGVSPSTIDSAVDSMSQAPDILCEGWEADDFIGMLMIQSALGPDAELEDLI